MKELNFEELMRLYAKGNQENAKDMFPYDARDKAINKVENKFYQYLLEDFFQHDGAFYAVWQEDNRYYSALRIHPYKDGFLLEALETAPDVRRRGYATKLIQTIQRLDLHGPIYSHVGKRNKASLKVHLSCDFHIIKDYATYADGSISTNSYTLVYHSGE